MLKNLEKILDRASSNSVTYLRVSIGIVYLWFGILKFFSGGSPAEDLAQNTMYILFLGLISKGTLLIILAVWESIIGLGFITGKYIKVIIILMLVHMIGTFTPLLFFPNLTFLKFPYAPTIIGQYIIKNLVLITGALAVWKSLPKKK